MDDFVFGLAFALLLFFAFDQGVNEAFSDRTECRRKQANLVCHLFHPRVFIRV